MQELIKKWWFWLIIVIIVTIIGFTIVMVVAFNVNTGGIHEIARRVQGIYEDSTIYSSSGRKTLVLELENWDKKNSDKLNQMLEVIKSKINDDEFSSYKKFVTITYMNTDNKEDGMILKTVCNLPDFTIISQEQYIDFEEYEDAVSKWGETTNLLKELYQGL